MSELKKISITPWFVSTNNNFWTEKRNFWRIDFLWWSVPSPSHYLHYNIPKKIDKQRNVYIKTGWCFHRPVEKTNILAWLGFV